MTQIKSAMVSVAGLKLSEQEKYLLSTHQPIGVTLFKRNIETPEQVQALTKEIREAIGRMDVLIAVDQEGGRVCRFAPPYFDSYISQYGIGSLPKAERLRLCALQGILIADELRSLGVNVNYAPCLDIRYAETASVLKSRCFSDDAKIVADCGRILINTYLENGIIPCMKHLPGHGRATVDPHLHLPHINQTIEELKADFLPFQVNADTCPMGMTAHIVIPSIDSALPVTQSAKGIQTLIRRIIGFDGFLLSDAIDMRALQGTLAEKTKSVLRAGCDAVCYCGGEVEELQAVLESTPVLTDDSLWRLNECLDIVNQNPKEMDILDLLRAEYDRLASKAQVPIEDYDAVEVLNQMKNKDK